VRVSSDVLFYGVVSSQTEKVVEFFLERETRRDDTQHGASTVARCRGKP
jgi:hypothetical protein